jgi:hypothetical protein
MGLSLDTGLDLAAANCGQDAAAVIVHEGTICLLRDRNTSRDMFGEQEDHEFERPHVGETSKNPLEIFSLLLF